LNNQNGHTLTFVLSVFSVSLVLAMVMYPETAFEGALNGLDVWWNIVFPALLPFFIGAQLLMGLGVVHFMGVLLEPFMRPLFNVPGTGAFVMAMGLASGYPIGSVLTARLRRQSLVTRAEAERLMSFTNTADPLFMSGAVAVGMFGNAALSGVIMVSHYISSLLTGLLLRYYKPEATITESPPTEEPLLARALNRMLEARKEDGRPFGQLLGDCVEDSIDTLLLVGGFIILFAVIIRILTAVGFVKLISALFVLVLMPLGLDIDTGAALFSGLFEITLGTQLAAQVAAPLLHQVVIASAIIAWSGFSVHAQVAAMIQGTDITMGPYMFSRLFHATCAGIVTALLWPLFSQLSSLAVLPALSQAEFGLIERGMSARLLFSFQWFALVCAVLCASCAVLHTLRALCNSGSSSN
jgi:sporulation integral membrane protein YlbJ